MQILTNDTTESTDCQSTLTENLSYHCAPNDVKWNPLWAVDNVNR